MKDFIKRPPLGLKPSWVMYRKRLKEIELAMKRYIDAGLTIPKEWIDEHNGIMNLLNERD